MEHVLNFLFYFYGYMAWGFYFECYTIKKNIAKKCKPVCLLSYFLLSYDLSNIDSQFKSDSHQSEYSLTYRLFPSIKSNVKAIRYNYVSDSPLWTQITRLEVTKRRTWRIFLKTNTISYYISHKAYRNSCNVSI